MKDIFLIDNLEALRAMSDPLRLRILECLHPEPLTASQVARKLGQRANKLHYHVTELERNGLIEAVETRQKGNLLETYYRPVARVFRVDSTLFERSSGPEALAVFYQNVATTLDITAADLKADIEAGKVTEKEAAASLRMLLRGRLSPEDVTEFKQRLSALITEFRQRSREDAPLPIALTLLFYALAPQTADAEGTDETLPTPKE